MRVRRGPGAKLHAAHPRRRLAGSAFVLQTPGLESTLRVLVPTMAGLLACTGVGSLDSAHGAADPLTAARLEAATRLVTAFGPRSSGTPGEAAAREGLASELVALGLPVERHGFVWEPWLRGDATISMGEARWPAQALSPSPPVEGLQAPLVDGDAPVIAGAIALFRSSDGSRAQQFSDAILGRAAGLIRVTDDLGHHGEELVEVGHTTGSGLPAVAVDRATGDALAGSSASRSPSPSGPAPPRP